MRKLNSSDNGFKKKPYPWVWVILSRETGNEDYSIYDTYTTKRMADAACVEVIISSYPTGNAYVQKYGPIS